MPRERHHEDRSFDRITRKHASSHKIAITTAVANIDMSFRRLRKWKFRA
jgi:hypothetical protein